MADTIIPGTAFDANKIKYTAPKVNASGGKSVGILSSETNSILRLSNLFFSINKLVFNYQKIIAIL